MRLETFFTSYNQRTLNEHSVTVFVGKKYPFLFFAAFLQKLRIDYSFSKIISYEDNSYVSLLAQLSTTFLGQKEVVWLGDISSLEDVDLKKKLLILLCTYTGPHIILAYVSSDDLPLSFTSFISLDEKCTIADRKMVITFLFPHVPLDVVEDFLKTARSESLDQAVIMAHYAAVIGKNNQIFKNQWLANIIEPEASLFSLSQYFFARKADLFWSLWSSLKNQYGVPFWTMYWSEQLWRAYYVIKLYKANNITEAKQLSFRLPFSFLQRDWKHISTQELERAHAFLYAGDYAFKNGSSEFFLEVFYSTFLAKQF